MIYGPGQKRPTSGQSPYLKFLEQNASKWQGVADQVLNPDSTQKSAPRIGQEANLDAAILKGGLATAKQGNTAEWQKYQQPNESALKAGLSNKIDTYNKNVAFGESQFQKDLGMLDYNRANMSPEAYAQQKAALESRRNALVTANKSAYTKELDKTEGQIARSQYINSLLGQATGQSDTSPLVAAINSYGAGNGPAQQISTLKGELAGQYDLNRPTGAVAQQIATQKAIDDVNSQIMKEKGDQRYAGAQQAAAWSKSLDSALTRKVPGSNMTYAEWGKKFGGALSESDAGVVQFAKDAGISRKDALAIIKGKKSTKDVQPGAVGGSSLTGAMATALPYALNPSLAIGGATIAQKVAGG